MRTPEQIRLAERRRALAVAVLVVAALVTVALAWAFLDLSGTVAVGLGSCILAAAAGGWSTARLARAHRARPSVFVRVATPAPDPETTRPRELQRIEQVVLGSLASALEVHTALLPLVREIAPGDPEPLRPYRARPAGAGVPGLDLATLRRVVDALEGQRR